jgi:hypothetical protein
MSLDNIQLPPTVIQQLFNNSLIDLNGEKKVADINAAASLSFLGNNEKKIILIVSEDDALYLREDSLNFLLSILTPCKLTLADVALINVKKTTVVSYHLLANELKAEKIILFGTPVSVLDLPLQFADYKLQQFNNQTYLSAQSLELIKNDKEAKLKLWACLKTMFNI